MKQVCEGFSNQNLPESGGYFKFCTFIEKCSWCDLIPVMPSNLRHFEVGNSRRRKTSGWDQGLRSDWAEILSEVDIFILLTTKYFFFLYGEIPCYPTIRYHLKAYEIPIQQVKRFGSNFCTGTFWKAYKKSIMVEYGVIRNMYFIVYTLALFVWYWI